MTVDGLAQEMALELGEQYGDLDISSQFQRWVQEIFDQIVSKASWFWVNGEVDVTPGAGTAIYTLPATVATIRTGVINTSPAPSRVSYCSIDRHIGRGDNLLATGTPKAWHLAGIDPVSTAIKVRFWPIPDAAFVTLNLPIKLYTSSRPQVLLPSDVLPLPAEYVHVMREGIRGLVARNDNDLEGAKASFDLFNNGIDELASRYNVPKRGKSRLRVKQIPANRQATAAEEG